MFALFETSGASFLGAFKEGASPENVQKGRGGADPANLRHVPERGEQFGGRGPGDVHRNNTVSRAGMGSCATGP